MRYFVIYDDALLKLHEMPQELQAIDLNIIQFGGPIWSSMWTASMLFLMNLGIPLLMLLTKERASCNPCWQHQISILACMSRLVRKIQDPRNILSIQRCPLPFRLFYAIRGIDHYSLVFVMQNIAQHVSVHTLIYKPLWKRMHRMDKYIHFCPWRCEHWFRYIKTSLSVSRLVNP